MERLRQLLVHIVVADIEYEDEPDVSNCFVGQLVRFIVGIIPAKFSNLAPYTDEGGVKPPVISAVVDLCCCSVLAALIDRIESSRIPVML